MSRLAIALERRRADQELAAIEPKIHTTRGTSSETLETPNPWTLHGDGALGLAGQAPVSDGRAARESATPRQDRFEDSDAGWLSRIRPKHLEKLVVAPDARPVLVEEYRKLAATLHHAQRERQIKVVMIASAVPGEGKTLASANIALTLSESYRRRVLLIDGDLRQSAIHAIFRLQNISGLTDGLRGASEQKMAINVISPWLSVLCGGPTVPDPMSLLTSDRMRDVVQEAALEFDWVIIDTPPVAMLPDASLLSAMVDVAVLVIRAGHTPHQAIQRAVDALGRERIIGVVLNQVDQRSVQSASYYRDQTSSPDRS